MTAMRQAVEQIEHEIANLRAIITELRPAALDELGLRAALEALLDRHREQSGLQIDGELALPDPRPASERLDADLETTVYRLVQEALTNVAKHARADHVRVAVGATRRRVSRSRCRTTASASTPSRRCGGFGLAGHARAGLPGRRNADARSGPRARWYGGLPCATASGEARGSRSQHAAS